MTVNQLGMTLAKLCSSLIPPVDGSICLFSASVLSKPSDFSIVFSTERKTTFESGFECLPVSFSATLVITAWLKMN